MVPAGVLVGFGAEGSGGRRVEARAVQSSREARSGDAHTQGNLSKSTPLILGQKQGRLELFALCSVYFFEG